MTPERRLQLSAAGRLGGLKRGPTKARTSEQARRAVLARWAKHNAEKMKGEQ